MLSKNPSASPASPRSGAKADAAETPAPLLDPRDTIEAASPGDGTINDPGASDNRPPGIDPSDPLFKLLG
jgi:hypothetical protein